jgi:hypothetical protein
MHSILNLIFKPFSGRFPVSSRITIGISADASIIGEP